MPGSKAEEFGLSEPNTERYTNCSSFAKVSQWSQINAGVYNGLGSSEYILIESEPLSTAEVTAWHHNYSTANPIGWVYRDLIRRSNFDPEGVPARDEPRVPMDELHRRPVGKIKDILIEDDE